MSPLVAFTARRNLDYLSERALWESTVRVSPANPRAHNNLGTVYEAQTVCKTRAEYTRALELEPRYGAARRNLVRVDLALGS